jgi:hypothetical protein
MDAASALADEERQAGSSSSFASGEQLAGFELA